MTLFQNQVQWSLQSPSGCWGRCWWPPTFYLLWSRSSPSSQGLPSSSTAASLKRSTRWRFWRSERWQRLGGWILKTGLAPREQTEEVTSLSCSCRFLGWWVKEKLRRKRVYDQLTNQQLVVGKTFPLCSLPLPVSLCSPASSECSPFTKNLSSFFFLWWLHFWSFFYFNPLLLVFSCPWRIWHNQVLMSFWGNRLQMFPCSIAFINLSFLLSSLIVLYLRYWWSYALFNYQCIAEVPNLHLSISNQYKMLSFIFYSILLL